MGLGELGSDGPDVAAATNSALVFFCVGCRFGVNLGFGGRPGSARALFKCGVVETGRLATSGGIAGVSLSRTGATAGGSSIGLGWGTRVEDPG